MSKKGVKIKKITRRNRKKEIIKVSDFLTAASKCLLERITVKVSIPEDERQTAENVFRDSEIKYSSIDGLYHLTPPEAKPYDYDYNETFQDCDCDFDFEDQIELEIKENVTTKDN